MRLIDADALKRECEKLPRVLDDEFIHFVKAKDITKTINNAPTVEAEPVRHGRWLTWEEILHVDKRAPNNLGVFCSMCNKHSDNMTNYCPVCGAEMDGEDEES